MSDFENRQYDTYDGKSRVMDEAIAIENVMKEKNVETQGMRVSLIEKEGRIHSLWLPNKPEGRFKFTGIAENEISSDLYIEARNGFWFLCSVGSAGLMAADGQRRSDVLIQDRSFIYAENDVSMCIVFAEDITKANTVFHNYMMMKPEVIHIGRALENDIIFYNKLASKHHAVLFWENEKLFIQDENSTNGVFVNGTRIDKATLKAGDIIYIFGLRIIVGINYLSINSDMKDVKINSEKLISAQHINFSDEGRDMIMEYHPEFFNRYPRHRMAIAQQDIMLEAPPLSLNGNNIPLLLRMGGSMVMSGASMLAGNMVSMFSSVLFPVLTQKYTDKQRKEYEERREQKYTEYLVNKKQEIKSEILQEQEALENNYPNLSDTLEFAEKGKRLWERRSVDDDFMTIRMGYGDYPMLANLDYPKHGFEIDTDAMVKKMYELADAPRMLTNVPVMVSFCENYVSGVLGKRKTALEFVRNFIMQIVMMHSYDELKIVLIGNEKEVDALQFVRYLPHFWNDQKDFRYLACDMNDAYQVAEYLKKEIGEKKERDVDLKDVLKERAYYMIIALDKKLFDSMEFLKEVMKEEKNRGVSVMTVFDELPKECSLIFDLKENGEHSIINLREVDKNNITFKLDQYQDILGRKSMEKLANTNLRMVSQAYALPKMITFLEMFDVGRIEHLVSANRWKENNPVKSLATPIGISTDGSLFCLDLHEKYQGPHGLVAGMTGSGKSEFIITYILSMAVNFHPDEVAFILIDYKGGGLTGAFEDEKRGIHLPHLVGTITNLDGASIQRSLVSIQSELKRRQRIFNEVKSATNEGTMDIYTYQKLYREQKVKEPLPHLFIISDEFAELKKQEPEFMDQLISAARIGRSLGVHLILATQKPSGVVDDQIWSNTKFRVCLRVQDRSDSFEMLKRPEAAELKDTGRFYLQVGYNEYFALGQSAWCGADYEPQDEVVVQKDEELLLLDSVGQSIVKKKPAVKKNISGEKQIVTVVNAISELARKEQIEPRQLWKDALGAHISLKDIQEQYEMGDRKGKLQAVTGVVDAPGRQSQFPLQIDLMNTGNLMLVGETGSGKTNFIQTMLFDLVANNSPEELNFYILDFSSRNLSIYREVPHCGEVLTDESEEKIVQVFDIIENIIRDRRDKFAKANVSTIQAYRKIEKIPVVLLVIDNILGFDEFRDKSEYISKISDFMSNGVSYGVRVIFTINQINDCPSKPRRLSNSKYVLRARDRYVYSDILDCRCRYEPADILGRGICVLDGECYEFQAALPFDDVNEVDRMERIKEALKGIAQRDASLGAAKGLEVIDEEQEYEEFCTSFEYERIPLGYSLDNKKVAIPLQQMYSCSLYFGNTRRTGQIFDNFIYAMKREEAEIILIPQKENSVWSGREDIRETVDDIYDLKEDGVKQLMDRLQQLVMSNKQYRNEYCEKEKITDWAQPENVNRWRKYVRQQTKPVVVFIESYIDFALNVDVENAAFLAQYFEMCVGFNVYFIAGFYSDDEEKRNQKMFPNGKADEEEQDEEKEHQRAEIRQALAGLQESYNKDKFTLLFGGHYKSQNLVPLSAGYDKEMQNDPKDDNKMLMYYRNTLYPMVMPLGELAAAPCDADEKPII